MRPLPQEALDQLFIQARTHSVWQDLPVSDDVLHHLYEVMKWGPTSANSFPIRLLFVRSGEAKEKLLHCVAPGNYEKTKSAPVTAIIAGDLEFYEKLPHLFPHADARSWFVGNQALIEATLSRNVALQGAYLMVAARALGLDCGPLSGFDNAKLDEAFLKGTSWRSNFLCNLGYGDSSKLFPRSPRPQFEEICKIF